MELKLHLFLLQNQINLKRMKSLYLSRYLLNRFLKEIQEV